MKTKITFSVAMPSFYGARILETFDLEDLWPITEEDFSKLAKSQKDKHIKEFYFDWLYSNIDSGYDWETTD